MAKRIAFGDIFEINTEKGFAYIQYVGKYTEPPYYGDLVRILDGIYQQRPLNLDEIASKKEVYYTFIATLQYSVNKKMTECVGWAPVPVKFKTIPEFRIIGVPDPITLKVDSWRIRKDGNEIKIGKLTEKYLDTPTLDVSSVGAIAREIGEGYTPRNDWFVTGLIPEIHEKLREKLKWNPEAKGKK